MRQKNFKKKQLGSHIDKKLAILESYLNENGHVGEAIGVSNLRDSKLVSNARSISEGRCAPPTPSDSCHDCDKVSEDIHMVIAYPANSKEYPKIKRMVRWHIDEAAQIDETSHVITGADRTLKIRLKEIRKNTEIRAQEFEFVPAKGTDVVRELTYQ